MKTNKMPIYLVLSQLFSVLGTVIIQFSLSLYILDLTGSSFTFGLMVSFAVFGRLFMLPFCGIIADRVNKKKIMIGMDSAYFLITLLMLGSLSFSNKIVLLGILTFLMGTISAFETPVVQASIPLICDKEMIPKINSTVSSIGLLGSMFGPIIAGVIYQKETFYQVFILCLVLFVLAILVEMRMNIQQASLHQENQRIFQIVKEDMSEVCRYLSKEKIILNICLLAFFLNFLLNSFVDVVVPYLARIWLGASNAQFGIMNFAFAAGGLLGSILYGVFSKKLHLSSIPLRLVVTGISFLFISLPLMEVVNIQTSFWLMTFIVALFLAIVSMISIQLVVYIQSNAPSHLLGRLMSFVMIICTLAIPLGQILFGFLSSHLSQGGMIYLIYGVGLITIVTGFFSKGIFVERKAPLPGSSSSQEILD